MEKDVMKFYYPHGLRMVSTQKLNTFFTVKGLEEECYVIEDLWQNKSEVLYTSPDYIPVLYPLGCLNVQLRVNGSGYFCPMDIIMEKFITYSSVILDGNDMWFREALIKFFNNESPIFLTHDPLRMIYSLLYKFHFDLDHLILHGQALDVTQLRWNPYETENITFD